MRNLLGKKSLTLIETRLKNSISIPRQVIYFFYLNIIVTNITEKPNYITPHNPYKEVKMDSLNDDVVDRAFRLEAMRRKI